MGYFSVNEVFCEVSAFGEKTGGGGRRKDMSRQKVRGKSDSLDSRLNKVDLRDLNLRYGAGGGIASSQKYVQLISCFS